MKETSDIYQDQMVKQWRNRSHVRIVIVSGDTTYEFNENDISSLQKSDDVDPLSRRVPKETISFSVFDFNGNYNPSNPEGKWYALDENAEIIVTFGFEVSKDTVEWLSSDYYFLDGKPTVQSGIVSFKGSSKLCHLTNTYYKGIYNTDTFFNLAKAVLEDAGIDSEHYQIDESLSDYTTNAPMPVTSHINCLQLISHACGCSLRTKSGVICIEPFSSSIVPDNTVISLNSIALNGDTISKIETLYKVQANLYDYKEESESTVIATFNIEAEGETQCHIEYDSSTSQTISVEGAATLKNINTYCQAADFILDGTGVFVVTVTGKKITSSVSTMESIISLNSNGSTDSEKNQLITSASMQYALIYHVSNYLLFRMTHSVKYRGNPEIEVLDPLFLETNYNSYVNGLVLSNTINFNGAISGNLTIKSLTEIQGVYLYDSNGSQVTDKNNETIGIIGMTDYQSDYTTSEMNDFITEVIGHE